MSPKLCSLRAWLYLEKSSLKRSDEAIRVHLTQYNCCLSKKRKFAEMPREKSPGEKTVSKWPSTRHGERPQEKPALLTPCPQPSSLQNCEKTNLCCLSHALCGPLWCSPSRLTRCGWLRVEPHWDCCPKPSTRVWPGNKGPALGGLSGTTTPLQREHLYCYSSKRNHKTGIRSDSYDIALLATKQGQLPGVGTLVGPSVREKWENFWLVVCLIYFNWQ